MQISHDALNSASLKSSMGARGHICIDLQAFESSKTCEKSHVFDWGSTGKAICKSERDEPQTHSARAEQMKHELSALSNSQATQPEHIF